MADNMKDIGDRIIDYTGGLPEGVDKVPMRQIIDFFNDDSVMKIHRTNFRSILTEDNFHVPKYQRLYSWDKENHEEFWEAVSNVFEIEYFQDEKTYSIASPKEVADTFFGTFFLADKSNQDRLEVIDGQQRITAGMLFLSIIKEELKETNPGNEKLREIKDQSIRQINTIIYTTPDDQREREPGITYTNEANNRLFYALISGEEGQKKWLEKEDAYDGRKKGAKNPVAIAKDLGIKRKVNKKLLYDNIYHPESNEKMLEAYLYFKEKIKSRIDDLKEEERTRALINLKNYLLRSFTVGKADIKSGSSPELRMGIFQAINDRGKELSKTDKIRARIANLFSETEEEKEYTDKWEEIVKAFGTEEDKIQDFLATYLTAYESVLETKSESTDKMMEAFSLRQRDSFKLESKLVEKSRAMKFIDELKDHTELYLDLTDPEDRDLDNLSTDNRKEFREMLRRLNSLNTKQWRSLVLRCYRATEEDGGEEDLLQLVDTVENLFLRLTISELRANNLEQTFPAVAHDLDENKLANANDLLVERARDDASPLFGDSFVDILVESDDVNDNDGKILLYKLSSALLNEKNKGRTITQELNIDNTDVEHILPKSLFHEGKENPFIWLYAFFDELEFEERRLDSMKRLEEDDPLYEAIQKFFVRDVGNLLLLKDRDNRALKNKPFSQKIDYYHNNDGLFDQIPVNKFFTEANDDLPDDKLDDIAGNEEFWDDYWNTETFTQRRISIIKQLLSYLELQNGEFEGIGDDLETAIRNEVEDRVERLRLEM